MDLFDSLNQFSKRIKSVQKQISTEEATKTAIIMPFFQLLGYDVFNPDEFIPEYVADVGIKKGEKVDYAIKIDNKLTMVIECKSINENLKNHSSQLYRYFATTNAKFALLTNGIHYKIYTDLENLNKMDKTPFLEFNLLNLKERDTLQIQKFHKSNFDIQSILNTAEELKYSTEIINHLNNQLSSPDDDFINYILNKIYSGRKTQNIIDRFKPIITKSFNIFFNEMVNKKLKTALDGNVSKEVASTSVIEPESESKIVTTKEELEGYYIVKNILTSTLDVSRVDYRDTERYFNVLLDNNIRKWICRLHFNSSKKYLEIRNSSSTQKYLLHNLYDIHKYSSEIIKVTSTLM